MERPKRPYSLNKRPTTKKNKYIYYVRFRDPETGKYLSAISSGCTSRAAAANWADEKLRTGIVLAPGKRNITFAGWVKDFWDPKGSTYIQGKIARGGTISYGYARNASTWTEKYILPYFEDKKLYEINRHDVERWQMALYDGAKLSPVTINKILSVLRIMFREAVHENIIPADPSAGIRDLKEEPRTRGILNLKKIQALFSPEALEEKWEANLQYYTAGLLAVSTGMRQGELRGLKWKHVYGDRIDILHSWEDQNGIKGAKWNSERTMPAPSRVAETLEKLKLQSEWRSGEDLVFSSVERSRPRNKKAFTGSLCWALKNAGIDDKERRERNLTFHSLRHTFLSAFRGRLPDAKLQHFSGHRTLEMMEPLYPLHQGGYEALEGLPGGAFYHFLKQV